MNLMYISGTRCVLRACLPVGRFLSVLRVLLFGEHNGHKDYTKFTKNSIVLQAESL